VERFLSNSLQNAKRRPTIWRLAFLVALKPYGMNGVNPSSPTRKASVKTEAFLF